MQGHLNHTVELNWVNSGNHIQDSINFSQCYGLHSFLAWVELIWTWIVVYFADLEENEHN